MKVCKRCRQQKPLSAFSPRKDAKDGLAYWCTPCKSAATVAGPRRKAVVDAYRERNREVCVERSLASMAKKPEHYAAKAAGWRRANREHRLALRRKRYAENPGKEIARVRARAGRLRITPVTVAEQAEIDGFYQFCRIFRGFEVDHVVPLNGEKVSGLHVPANLQVLPRSMNRSKGAKFEAA